MRIYRITMYLRHEVETFARREHGGQHGATIKAGRKFAEIVRLTAHVARPAQGGHVGALDETEVVFAKGGRL